MSKDLLSNVELMLFIVFTGALSISVSVLLYPMIGAYSILFGMGAFLICVHYGRKSLED